MVSAPLDHPMKVTFALKQTNLDKLEALFWERSDPASATFGQWMETEEIANLIQPTQQTVIFRRFLLLPSIDPDDCCPDFPS